MFARSANIWVLWYHGTGSSEVLCIFLFLLQNYLNYARGIARIKKTPNRQINGRTELLQQLGSVRTLWVRNPKTKKLWRYWFYTSTLILLSLLFQFTTSSEKPNMSRTESAVQWASEWHVKCLWVSELQWARQWVRQWCSEQETWEYRWRIQWITKVVHVSTAEEC